MRINLLGGVYTTLSPNTDVNNILDTGIYFVYDSSCLNLPSNTRYGILIVFAVSGYYRIQMYYKAEDIMGVFVRAGKYDQGVYTEWKEI